VIQADCAVYVSPQIHHREATRRRRCYSENQQLPNLPLLVV
jgi:hypothetical protein